MNIHHFSGQCCYCWYGSLKTIKEVLVQLDRVSHFRNIWESPCTPFFSLSLVYFSGSCKGIACIHLSIHASIHLLNQASSKICRIGKKPHVHSLSHPDRDILWTLSVLVTAHQQWSVLKKEWGKNVVPIPGSKFGAVWPGNPEVSENGLEVGRRHRDSRWAPPLGSMDTSPTEQSRTRGEVRPRAEPLVAQDYSWCCIL